MFELIFGGLLVGIGIFGVAVHMADNHTIFEKIGEKIEGRS